MVDDVMSGVHCMDGVGAVGATSWTGVLSDPLDVLF